MNFSLYYRYMFFDFAYTKNFRVKNVTYCWRRTICMIFLSKSDEDVENRIKDLFTPFYKVRLVLYKSQVSIILVFAL